MFKKSLCLMLLCMCFSAFSQTPGKYLYKGEEYFVFPYRIDNTDDIPMMGYRIPDGKYVAFSVYNFAKPFGLKKDRAYKLTDTTIVRAVFTVKNNVAQGKAEFYAHKVTKKRKEVKTPREISSGELVNNLKNGVWTASLPGKQPYLYATFKNGVQDGYRTLFDNEGRLSSKTKYKEGEVCDTLFNYENGRLEMEYDIITGDVVFETSCYSNGLVLLEIEDQMAKTFYRKYDENGKLIFDLRYHNGNILPYDSIGISGKASFTYVTVKNIGGQKKLMTQVFHNNYYKSKVEEYYDSTYLYKSSERFYRNNFKKKLFSRKKIIQSIDTSITEKYFVNPRSINDSSIVPVLVEKEVKKDETIEVYYIPKYKFAFKKEVGTSFMDIDKKRAMIFLKDSVSETYSNYSKKQSSVYIDREQQALSDLRVNPSIEKSFMTYEEIPDFASTYNEYNYSLEDLRSSQFYTFPLNQIYYKEGMPLNGAYYFSSLPKHKHWPKDITHTGYTNLEEGLTKGIFSNGRKEGLWLQAYYEDEPKKTPADLKAWFFKHPDNARRFIEQHYKNGMKEGTCMEYSQFNPKSMDYRSKEPVIIYKQFETEYTRDTLNGSYKEFHENNRLKKETHFAMGAIDGVYKEYTNNGQLFKTIHYTKGKLDGSYIRYYDNRVSCYANFRNNLLCDSLVYYFYEGGTESKILARNDTLLKKMSYFDNGKLKELIEFSKQSSGLFSIETINSENYITNLRSSGDATQRNTQALYKNYYDNGQLLSEGQIKNSDLSGVWKFYSITGAIIHEVNFADTMVTLPNSTESIDISGFYTGYYSNGNKRCTGYIKDIELSYDCFTKQDKADLDFYPLDFFDINGKQTLKNGNGYFIKYDANGLRAASGKLVNCREDSLWKYYTPEQKLEETGFFVNNKKDGVWYKGSLEGTNFEDGACFNMDNPEEVKAFEQKRKDLQITRTIYKNGKTIEKTRFDSNLNKTFQSRTFRRGSYRID